MKSLMSTNALLLLSKAQACSGSRYIWLYFTDVMIPFHTHVPLSPRSVIRYRSIVGDALWLGGLALFFARALNSYTIALRVQHPFTRTLSSDICYFKFFCLSSVTFVRPTQVVETFGNISSSFCTLAILWPPCKILQRLLSENPSVGALKIAKYGDIKFCSVVYWWISCILNIVSVIINLASLLTNYLIKYWSILDMSCIVFFLEKQFLPCIQAQTT